MGRKKKFIDKRHAQTFRLVHRSQHDPLVADETATQRVFVGVDTSQNPHHHHQQQKPQKHPVQAEEEVPDKFKKLQERTLYGLHFDDDDEYDYMQHLRPSGNAGAEVISAPTVGAKPTFKNQAIQLREDVDGAGDASAAAAAGPVTLPPEVLPSKHEEPVGLLALQAKISGPQPEWDPDVIAALDEDFEFEDPDFQMLDGFVVEANRDAAEDEDEDGSDWETASDSDGVPSAGGYASSGSGDEEDGRLHSFDKEETKSRFTEYSMSSSILPRNDALQLHDARFEKLYEQYDDDQIGGLDSEEDEIGGSAPLENFGKVFDQFLNGLESQRGEMLEAFDSLGDKPTTLGPEYTPAKHGQQEGMSTPGEGQENGEEQEEEKRDENGNSNEHGSSGKTVIFLNQESEKAALDRQFMLPYGPRPERKWDCESILSLSSTAYNHPTVIPVQRKPRKITLHKKTGVPMDVFEDRRRGIREEPAAAEEEEEEVVDTSIGRSRSESAEEKKQRKQALKQQRRERRQTKKATKMAFKTEQQRQAHVRTSLSQHPGARLS